MEDTHIRIVSKSYGLVSEILAARYPHLVLPEPVPFAAASRYPARAGTGISRNGLPPVPSIRLMPLGPVDGFALYVPMAGEEKMFGIL